MVAAKFHHYKLCGADRLGQDDSDQRGGICVSLSWVIEDKYVISSKKSF